LKSLIRLTALSLGLAALFASSATYGDMIADSLAGNFFSEQPVKPRHGVSAPVREKTKKKKKKIVKEEKTKKAEPKVEPKKVEKPKEEKPKKEETKSTPKKDDFVDLVFPKGKAPSKYLKSATIWRSFAENFQLCKPKPNCYPVDIGTWGLRSVNPYTCHAQGKAIDVGGIACPGMKTARAGAATGVFADFVKCMTKEKKVTGADGKTKIVVMKHKIYRDFNKLARTGDRTLAHFDHVHLSNGCLARGVRAY
jgi:hypothetical protein